MTTDTTHETTTQGDRGPFGAHVHLNGHADLGPCHVKFQLLPDGSFAYLVESIETGHVTMFSFASPYRMDLLPDEDVEKLRRDRARRDVIAAKVRAALDAEVRAARAAGKAIIFPARQGAWAVRVEVHTQHVRGTTPEMLRSDMIAALAADAPDITGEVSVEGRADLSVMGDRDVVDAVADALRAMGFGEVKVAAETFDLFDGADIPF